MLAIVALVSAGGALGAVARAVVEDAWPHPVGGIGWATFIINVSGCFLLGVLVAALDRWRPQQRLLRPFLGVGVLAGYTTFSTHILDVAQVVDHGRLAAALALLGAQLLTGVAAVAAGSYLVARRAVPR